MSSFTAVHVIYNPNSTGPGEKLARALQRALKKVEPNLRVELISTDYAGHAEELAYDYAIASNRPLIVSASGDGGYHEVVNGLLRAQDEGATPTAGLLPGGNANDHYSTLHTGGLVTRITSRKTTAIDLLELRGKSHGKRFKRYAHSYIGFGLTPDIGAELNKVSLNILKEAWLVTKGLLTFRPIRITQAGKTKTYDSIICSNIGQMSKYITLSTSASPDDGLFEVTLFRRHNKTRLLRRLLKASLFSLDGSKQEKRYTFRTTHPINVQLDGEIFKLDAQSHVTVSIKPKQLRCLI